MGTHPIFESDFDCLTECLSQRKMIASKFDEDLWLPDEMWKLIRMTIEKREQHDIERLREVFNPYCFSGDIIQRDLITGKLTDREWPVHMSEKERVINHRDHIYSEVEFTIAMDISENMHVERLRYLNQLNNWFRFAKVAQ